MSAEILPPLPVLRRLPPGVTYFASGASAPADLRGFVRLLHPVGVSIPELSEPVIAEICALADAKTLAGTPARIPVLADTSAFSEVTFGPDGPRIVAPITDEAWVEIVAVASRIAVALGSCAHVVAPDCVGNQGETLRRLTLFAGEVKAMRAAGAHIIVPIQIGAASAADFHASCARVLGFDDFTPGIPGNKRAMPAQQIVPYLAATRPHALHLLGIGRQSRRLHGLVETIRRAAGPIPISCDSNLLASMTGRTNGRGGGSRPITAWQHEAERASGAGERSGRARARGIAAALRFDQLFYLSQDLLRAHGMTPWPERTSPQPTLFPSEPTP